MGLSTLAQRNTTDFNFGEKALGNELKLKETRPNSQIANNQDRVLNVLWTENFTTGTGLATANGTWVTAGANGGYWTIASTAHPLSIYGWTHAMTGRHMRWDSYNPNDAEVNFATTVINGSITSPSMDLSGALNGAILEFETESMYCCNANEKPWMLYVSQDDGGSWSPAIPLDFGVDRNVATEDVAHPMSFSVDISSYISTTPGTVKIRIAWEATNADGNGQINTHYFWMLDNMTIYETPLYQIEHSKLWIDDIINRYENGDVPLSQAGPLTVQSKVYSLGSLTPTNFALEVTVYDGAMVQVHQETGGTLLNAPLTLGQVDTITFTTAFDLAAQPIGTYNIRVVTVYDETDELPENDTLWRTLELTQNTMSHFDYDQPMFSTSQDGTAPFDPHSIGAAFLMDANEQLHGINFYVANSTDLSNDIEFYIYKENGTATPDFFAGPYTFSLTDVVVNQITTFNLHMALEVYDPILLTAGDVYYAVLTVNGFKFHYGMNPIDSDNSGRVVFEPDWYLSGDEPMIALNFDQSLSTTTNVMPTANIGQNVPNPFNGTSVITYSLIESANVAVEFVDVTGKVVKSITPGNQAAGTYSITIDGADLAEGVYFYTFTIDGQKITKQMVVTK